MKTLITGAGGTVGRALTAHLQSLGHDSVGWDRASVPIDSYHDMEAYVRETDPDAIFHLAIASRPTGVDNEDWLVNYQWPSELAWIARIQSIPFIFTSTVLVFAPHQNGPFAPGDEPLSEEPYGSIKSRAEQRVFSQNPSAVVARLGWQIGDAPGSNNMIDFLHKTMTDKGEIRASTVWYPACGFLQDTAAALFSLIEMPKGLYQIDQNRGWSFRQIAEALNRQRNNPWKIVPDDGFKQDQRMLETRLEIPSLRDRLPDLPEIGE